jgi:hydrogenase nickel incorporation protein HypB
MKKVNILKPVLVSNKERARENRRFFDCMNSLVVNIISSPGAGKTSLISRFIEHFKNEYTILIIEGDIRGDIDSSRLSKLGVDVVQINTLTECHLDAFMIAQALPKIKKKYDLVFVENVGNLVCPAEFEIGEDFKCALLSTPEGDDKPFKYPLLFHLAKVIIINKCDLVPYVNFDLQKAKEAIKKENPKAYIFEVSAKDGEGLGALYRFFKKNVEAKKKNTKR